MNITRTYSAAAVAALFVTGALSGCTSSGQAETVAGDSTASASTPPAIYTGEPVRLTLGTDDSPGVPSADQIQHFAEQVTTLSQGKITIEPKWHAEGTDHPTDWDQAVAAMVQDGQLDLALAPTWAWDVLGVTSLAPLQAPFLVDSDELVAKIVSDDQLADQLMSGLAGAGVVGVSMWPEGLRHPFGFEDPLLESEDYAGQVIRSAKSETIAQLFEALGATTSPQEPNAETMAGLQGEFALNPNGVATANVTFFPKVNLLYANAERYDALDEQAVRVLADAAVATRAWAIEKTSDVEAGAAFCADGGTIVAARQADVSALQEATAPVSEAIAEAAGNPAVLDQIAALKESTGTPQHADTCTGEELTKHEPGDAEAALNGAYRFVITEQDWLDNGYTEQDAVNNAGVHTYVLDDGEVHYRLDPSERDFAPDDPSGPDETDGTYQVDANVITFWFPAYNEVDRLWFKVAAGGDLLMTVLDVEGNANVRYALTAKPWDKIA